MGSYSELQDRGLAELEADRNGNRNPHPIPSDVALTEPAERAWADVMSELYRTQHRSAITFWIAPCPLVGELDGALVIAGPPRCTEWVRRKYAKAIKKAIREVTDFEGLIVADREEA